MCIRDRIQASYDDGKTDEFVVPAVVAGEDGNAIGTIRDNDSVIFFNFRPDRAREMTRAFCDDEFTGFARAKRIKTTYVCSVSYTHLDPYRGAGDRRTRCGVRWGADRTVLL